MMNNLAQAEKAYLSIAGGDEAVIEMYKKHKQYNDLIRFVKTSKSADTKKTYIYVGQELQKANKLRDAEKYYLCCEEWKLAIGMYKCV